MNKDEMLKVQEDMKESYCEGFDDCLYKTAEYLKETCWLKSMAHVLHQRRATEYYRDKK